MSLKQKGFTLIELMIVIAIVAILVALAVPAYQDYTIRTKIGECVNNAAVPKLQISEYRETVGDMPANSDEAGLTGAGQSIHVLPCQCRHLAAAIREGERQVLATVPAAADLFGPYCVALVQLTAGLEAANPPSLT